MDWVVCNIYSISPIGKKFSARVKTIINEL